jgi:single-strand DNA-binding protein
MPTTKTNTKATESTSAPDQDRPARQDSVNTVTLIGRFVATPVMRQTGSGKHVTTARVATNDPGGVEYHDVVLWGQLADFATEHLGKGRLVYVEGRLRSRTWEATDGTPRRTIEIVANRLQALSHRESTGSAA